MHIASETKTVGLTAGLAGFESEQHSHVSLLLLYEGPLRYVPSYIGPVGRGLFVECSGDPQHTARISVFLPKVVVLCGFSRDGKTTLQVDRSDGEYVRASGQHWLEGVRRTIEEEERGHKADRYRYRDIADEVSSVSSRIVWLVGHELMKHMPVCHG